MNYIKKQLEEKRLTLHSLIKEIRELESIVLEQEWKDKPECSLSFKEISNNSCPYGKTVRSMIYCNNPNCHK